MFIRCKIKFFYKDYKIFNYFLSFRRRFFSLSYPNAFVYVLTRIDKRLCH